jgi:hypothetical protein
MRTSGECGMANYEIRWRAFCSVSEPLAVTQITAQCAFEKKRRTSDLEAKCPLS